jgi:pyruvate/2-oxoglutarate dehydrogenase complex dihydrolipoamide acyltransferase (E2) component
VNLPLIAVGGLATPADVAAAVHAGADAVAVGTVLLRSNEAGTTAAHKAALADPARTTTVLTRAFTGRPARALRNEFIGRYGHLAPFGYPAVHHLTSPLRKAAAAAGDPERMHLWAGTGRRHPHPPGPATVGAGPVPSPAEPQAAGPDDRIGHPWAPEDQCQQVTRLACQRSKREPSLVSVDLAFRLHQLSGRGSLVPVLGPLRRAGATTSPATTTPGLDLTNRAAGAFSGCTGSSAGGGFSMR